jgi:hypothetical protein
MEDGDLGQCRGIGREAGAQRRRVRQAPGVELGLEGGGQLRLAGALMGEARSSTAVRKAKRSGRPARRASKAPA